MLDNHINVVGLLSFSMILAKTKHKILNMSASMLECLLLELQTQEKSFLFILFIKSLANFLKKCKSETYRIYSHNVHPCIFFTPSTFDQKFFV